MLLLDKAASTTAKTPHGRGDKIKRNVEPWCLCGLFCKGKFKKFFTILHLKHYKNRQQKKIKIYFNKKYIFKF